MDPEVDQYELDQNMAQAWSWFPESGLFHHSCNQSCRCGKNGYGHYCLCVGECVGVIQSDQGVVHHNFYRSGDKP